MSTHEFTAADCNWADLHFSDLGEAREHLDDLIETRKSLESMKRLKEHAKTDIPEAVERIELGIKELEKQESELVRLITECSINPLFD